MKISRSLIKNLLFLQGAFILYSIVTVVSKLASSNSFLSPKFMLLYGVEVLILFVYAVFWQQIIKRIDLSVAYSNRGMIIFWTMMWSVCFFNEKISIQNIIGVIIIFIGIVVVTKDE